MEHGSLAQLLADIAFCTPGYWDGDKMWFLVTKFWHAPFFSPEHRGLTRPPHLFQAPNLAILPWTLLERVVEVE